MIVKTIKRGECTCHFDDSSCSGKTPEEVENIVRRYSEFIAACLLKKETA